MYDLNMKEIKFPEGLMPLDIFVGSIAKERATETIEGRSGIVDYGTNYVDRPVELSMWINSSDTTDYRLLRNELYALFDTGNAFYIEETRVPSRVLKVAVDESFIPDRLTIRNASVDVTCRTLDSVFWESKYTTLELHDSGYAHSAEKYGLVDNIDDEKVQYRFKNDTQIIAVSGWNDGGIAISNGVVDTGNVNNIFSNEITVTPGMVIDFEDLANHPNINYWRAFEYNGSTFIRVIQGSPGTNTLSFTTTGNRIRFATSVHPKMPVRAVNVGVAIRPQVGNRITTTNFKVYNAGNVTVEPESMYLKIYASLVTGDEFTITNHTTGEVFKLLKSVSGRNISTDGMIIKNGTFNAFRDTNKRFISLVPGDNQIGITGATFKDITFSFKYYYK